MNFLATIRIHSLSLFIKTDLPERLVPLLFILLHFAAYTLHEVIGMRRMAEVALVLVVCFFAALLCISADSGEYPDVRAYVLMEGETRTALESKNADMQLNAGYLSKLMSILLVAEHIQNGDLALSDEITASGSVRNTKGAVIWLEQGDVMTAEELLKSVIIGNANDALTVLAERVSGDIDGFVMDMNAKAFDLGLRDTVFVSPYGYFSEEEHTTAADMAVICSELLKYDFLTPFFSTRIDRVRDGKFEIVSENKMTVSYGLHIGFKACHSERSGYCIAECGRNDKGNVFIAVSLGADSEEALYSSAKQLLKKAFRTYKVVLTMFPDEMMLPLKVTGGTETAVEISLASQGKLAVPKAEDELVTKVVIPEYISAPVRKGQPIGCAAFYCGDSLVYEAAVIADSDIEALSFDFIVEAMLLKLIG